jgi:hypothetical protein
MTSRTLQADRLADEIRKVYAKDPQKGERRIADYLDDVLDGRSFEERIGIVREVLERFDTASEEGHGMDNTEMLRLFGLLLGRKVEQDDLSSGELLHRLAESLNTIFDALNKLISMINMSFSGSAGGDQTIRQFIGFHLGGDDQTKSMQAYLGQINKAFLTTHEAFKGAARAKMKQVLDALDPAQVAKERGSGLKIGPLRKAEDYDILKEKIERIQRWFESGRFMEDFLREFENNCQNFDST